MKPKEYVFRMFQHGKDEESLHSALSDPRVVRHMATEKITFQDCEQIVGGALTHWADFRYGSWAVVHSQTDTVIGWAGFKNWRKDEVELLCVLSPEYWGLGKSILEDLLEYAIKKRYINNKEAIDIIIKRYNIIDYTGVKNDYRLHWEYWKRENFKHG